jgi:divalent metal cation (Fe/Co/Zn/Cd) transporter
MSWDALASVRIIYISFNLACAVSQSLRVCPCFSLVFFCSADLVQSLIVVVAGVALWIRPHWCLADPVAAIVSSVLVISLTAARTVDAMRSLLKPPPPCPPAVSAPHHAVV